MARRTHGDDKLAGTAWFVVILALGIAGWLLWPSGDSDAGDPLAGGIEVELRADIEAARAAGLVEATESVGGVLEQTVGALSARLNHLGYPAQVRHDGTDRIFVQVPAVAGAVPADAMQAMTAGGEMGASGPLALRLVVEPLKWDAADMGYEEFKVAEVLRWQQASSDGTAYQPGHADFYVAPRAGTLGEELWDFVVLEKPRGAFEWLFGGAMLERPQAQAAQRGRQTLTFRIKEPLRVRFRDFTRKHKGRRMAILVDGEVAARPRIADAIDGSLAISLDRVMSTGDAQAMAKRWIAGGPLRVRCYYVAETARK